MTEKDKQRFDDIFHSDRYFRDLTDCDFIRSAGECAKLFDYLQNEGVQIEEALDVKKYMQFAFWLGAIESKDYFRFQKGWRKKENDRKI